MRLSILLSVLFSFSIYFRSDAQQIINAYAKVTNITGTALTVSNVDQNNHVFVVGEYVVIMQMQDDVIGSFIGNNANFGNLAGISSAGLYEIRKIVSINSNTTLGATAAAITTITLDALNYSYNTGNNSSVQLITFRRMATSDYTTTFDIEAKSWNGNIGGVIGMEVPGVLTLNNNIRADYDGFDGGSHITSNSEECDGNTWVSSSARHAYKGEGIYKATSINYMRAKAKILTGGGGGNRGQNGGGGGGNYSPGGRGEGCHGDDGAGEGGIGLSFLFPNASLSMSRIFLGGGGGGGSQAEGTSTNGGKGGGIIIIKAAEITDNCNHKSITANGEAAQSQSNGDGAGGGGAGGMIVLDVNIWSLSNCSGSLQISANGGDGGEGEGDEGGGGGQGLVVFVGVNNEPNEVNANANPGDGSSGAQDGQNLSNSVQFYSGLNTPLPVELTYFNAVLLENETVQISWQTAAEINSDYFRIEKSADGLNWEELEQVNAAGNSMEKVDYAIIDTRPFHGISYYRLNQIDFDGENNEYGVRSIIRDGAEIIVFPNPAENRIEFQGPIGSFDYVELYDMLGKNVRSLVSFDVVSENQLTLRIDQLESGIYFLKTKDAIIRFVKK